MGAASRGMPQAPSGDGACAGAGLGEDEEAEEEQEDEADIVRKVTAAVASRRALMQDLEASSSEDTGREGPLQGRTTVMMRNIPCKHTPPEVMKEINDAGFLGRYDFFYLPMDSRSRSNRGFAFINFDSGAAADEFFRAFNDQRMQRRFNSEKVITVMPADLQGFEENAYHFAASFRQRRKRTTESVPLFFRPLPSFLGNESALQYVFLEPKSSPWSHHDQGRAKECQTYAQAWLSPEPKDSQNCEQWPWKGRNGQPGSPSSRRSRYRQFGGARPRRVDSC